MKTIIKLSGTLILLLAFNSCIFPTDNDTDIVEELTVNPRPQIPETTPPDSVSNLPENPFIGPLPQDLSKSDPSSQNPAPASLSGSNLLSEAGPTPSDNAKYQKLSLLSQTDLEKIIGQLNMFDATAEATLSDKQNSLAAESYFFINQQNQAAMIEINLLKSSALAKNIYNELVSKNQHDIYSFQILETLADNANETAALVQMQNKNTPDSTEGAYLFVHQLENALIISAHLLSNDNSPLTSEIKTKLQSFSQLAVQTLISN